MAITPIETILILQARMGSTRLPGKHLKPIMQKPMLFFLLTRLKNLNGLCRLVLATTKSPKDDSLAQFCEANDFSVFRGSEEDVLDRFFECGKHFNGQVIVRITADCPLIDPRIIAEMIHEFWSFETCDYYSNTLKRTYPRGMDVEIFKKQLLFKAQQEAIKPYQREHVTPYFYQHPEQFACKNKIYPRGDFSKYRLTVDTLDDFTLIAKILEALHPKDPLFSLEDMLGLLEVHPDWYYINQHIQQKTI